VPVLKPTNPQQCPTKSHALKNNLPICASAQANEHTAMSHQITRLKKQPPNLCQCSSQRTHSNVPPNHTPWKTTSQSVPVLKPTNTQQCPTKSHALKNNLPICASAQANKPTAKCLTITNAHTHLTNAHTHHYKCNKCTYTPLQMHIHTLNQTLNTSTPSLNILARRSMFAHWSMFVVIWLPCEMVL